MNQGTLELKLLHTDGTPARDPRTVTTFLRTPRMEEIKRVVLSFPPVRRVSVPAFPQERAIACTITPKRYRSREVGIFTFTHGETIHRQPDVFRLPQLWSPSFTKWASLGDAFDPLTTVLEASPDVRIKDGKLLGTFTKEVYDGVDPAERPAANAKACLLNLFAKLDAEKEPVLGRKPWFRFVTTMLVIDRERFVALVDNEMFARVSEIHKKIDRFPDYKRTPTGDHNKNIPPGFTFKKADMVSIKTKEVNGNLQLTVTPATDASGASVTILDTDIDENGKLMAHLADLFKHKVTGGTHPFDIHEYLRKEAPQRDLGYELV
jgi:hypothetical protein